MGFFDDIPRPEPPRPEPGEDGPGPWIGGVVPEDLVVARTERAAVVITGIKAFPEGFAGTGAHPRARAGQRSSGGARSEQSYWAWPIPVEGDITRGVSLLDEDAGQPSHRSTWPMMRMAETMREEHPEN